MKHGLRQCFEAIHLDKGGRSVGVIVAVLAIALLAVSPAAGALVDDTRAPQQQMTVPDNNTTSIPENATTSAVTTSTGKAESSANRTATESNISSSDVRFEFPNQTTNGTSIEVVAPRLPDGGFLVVHGSSFPNNGIGSTIGISEYIAPNSSYNGVEIRLFDVPSRTFDQQRLRSPTTIYVTAALDTNDNQQYDYLATAGAQDIGYVVDGRQAVLSAEIEVNRTGTSSDPAARYGVNAGSSGSNGSANARAGSQSQSGARSSGSGSGSSNSSTGSSSGFFDLSGNTSPIGAGSNNSSVTGTNSSNGSAIDSLTQQAGNFGPVLVLISAGAIWMYSRHRG